MSIDLKKKGSFDFPYPMAFIGNLKRVIWKIVKTIAFFSYSIYDGYLC